MAAHEEACVRRRLETSDHSFELAVRNTLVQPADPRWLDGADAFVIGGSGAFSVHDPRSQPWVTPMRTFLDRALAKRIPGFGICFGHQLLGVHMGANVRTEAAHAEVGTIDLELTEAGRRDRVFGGLDQPLRAQTGHSDSVMSVPEGVELLATSTKLDTQAFKVRDAPMWSAQFHPDLTGAEARARYEAYQAALARSNVDAPREGTDRFLAGADEASALLGRFLDVVMSEP